MSVSVGADGAGRLPQQSNELQTANLSAYDQAWTGTLSADRLQKVSDVRERTFANLLFRLSCLERTR
jgi:hypothetical protein